MRERYGVVVCGGALNNVNTYYRDFALRFATDFLLIFFQKAMVFFVKQEVLDNKSAIKKLFYFAKLNHIMLLFPCVCQLSNREM